MSRKKAAKMRLCFAAMAIFVRPAEAQTQPVVDLGVIANTNPPGPLICCAFAQRRLNTALGLIVNCLPQLLAGLLATSTSALACPNLSEADAIVRGESEKAEAEKLVQALYAESDLVLIGRVVSLAEEHKPRAMAESGVLGDQYTVRAEVEALRSLKGFAPSHLVVEYIRDEGSFAMGCSSLADFREVSLNDTYRYLLYVKAGAVLRASLVVDWFDGLAPEYEKQIIQRTAARPN